MRAKLGTSVRRVGARLAMALALVTVAVAVVASLIELMRRLGEPERALGSTVGGVTMFAATAGAFTVLCVALFRRRSTLLPGQADIARLEVAAKTDSLTGLANLRTFHHDLAVEIQRRGATGSFFTLMAIDLDGLKQINDAHGHPAGDAHIRAVADAIRRATGDDGTVYRTGGDEFMVLLPGRRNWDGLALAQRINQLTRAAVGRRALSIGLAESTGTEARQVVIHQADIALYEAKRTKLTAVAYHPGLAPAGAEEGHWPSHHQKTLAAALARAVDAKDVGTRSHSETVAQLCVGIGQRLGIRGEELERLRLAGLLHDVGKIGVPDAILQKRHQLAGDEADEMKLHVTIGHEILVSAEMATEAEWVLHHHERVDGKGYPAGLRGDEIPLESRIIAVADAFEAMTGSRPYRDRISTEEALSELEQHVGTQFDRRCLSALIEVVAESSTTDVAGSPTSAVGRAAPAGEPPTVLAS